VARKWPKPHNSSIRPTHTKSTHPVTEMLSTFSTAEEILFHTVKNWWVTADPPAEWENITGGSTVNWGHTPNPPVIPTLVGAYSELNRRRPIPTQLFTLEFSNSIQFANWSRVQFSSCVKSTTKVYTVQRETGHALITWK